MRQLATFTAATLPAGRMFLADIARQWTRLCDMSVADRLAFGRHAMTLEKLAAGWTPRDGSDFADLRDYCDHHAYRADAERKADRLGGRRGQFEAVWAWHALRLAATPDLDPADVLTEALEYAWGLQEIAGWEAYEAWLADRHEARLAELAGARGGHPRWGRFRSVIEFAAPAVVAA